MLGGFLNYKITKVIVYRRIGVTHIADKVSKLKWLWVTWSVLSVEGPMVVGADESLSGVQFRTPSSLMD